jgi:aminotransferase
MESSYYFYWIQTKPEIRDRLAKYLRERGIYTTFRYYPLHWVKFYGAQDIRLPNAESAALSTLCIPIHQSLSNDDLDKIIESIYDFGRKYI